MFNPCSDYCYIRLGKQYEPEVCDVSCEYAKLAVENRELKKKIEEYERKYSANSIKKHNLILRLLDKLSEVKDAKRKERSNVSRRQVK